MSRKTPMALFDLEPIEPEPEARPPRPPSKRELARQRSADRKAERERAATHRSFDDGREAHRAPKRFSIEEARAASLAEAERLRRKRFTDWGLDPDAPDREERYKAEEQRLSLLVQQGWTFIRGRQERMEDWLRERDALDAQAREKKAEEDRKRAEAKAERRKRLRAPGGAPVNRDWTDT